MLHGWIALTILMATYTSNVYLRTYDIDSLSHVEWRSAIPERERVTAIILDVINKRKQNIRRDLILHCQIKIHESNLLIQKLRKTNELSPILDDLDHFKKSLAALKESPEAIFNVPLCATFSNMLAIYLRERGLEPYIMMYLFDNKEHECLGLLVKNTDGKIVELKVDAVYRLFFFDDMERDGLTELHDKLAVFKYLKMPEIFIGTIDEANNFFQTLPYRPFWMTPKKVIERGQFFVDVPSMNNLYEAKLEWRSFDPEKKRDFVSFY